MLEQPLPDNQWNHSHVFHEGNPLAQKTPLRALARALSSAGAIVGLRRLERFIRTAIGKRRGVFLLPAATMKSKSSC